MANYRRPIIEDDPETIDLTNEDDEFAIDPQQPTTFNHFRFGLTQFYDFVNESRKSNGELTHVDGEEALATLLAMRRFYRWGVLNNTPWLMEATLHDAEEMYSFFHQKALQHFLTMPVPYSVRDDPTDYNEWLTFIADLTTFLRNATNFKFMYSLPSIEYKMENIMNKYLDNNGYIYPLQIMEEYRRRMHFFESFDPILF